jgi:hypothetical protein
LRKTFRILALLSAFGICATAAPIIDAYGGTDLGLTDDSTAPISLNPAGFTFFGINYTGATVSSNGFVQFGGSDGDLCCNGDAPDS